MQSTHSWIRMLPAGSQAPSHLESHSLHWLHSAVFFPIRHREYLPKHQRERPTGIRTCNKNEVSPDSEKRAARNIEAVSQAPS